MILMYRSLLLIWSLGRRKFGPKWISFVHISRRFWKGNIFMFLVEHISVNPVNTTSEWIIVNGKKKKKNLKFYLVEENNSKFWTIAHFSFDIEAKTWNIIAAMNDAGYRCPVSLFKNYICVATFGSVQFYEPESNKWTRTIHGKLGTVWRISETKECLYSLSYNRVVYKFDLNECTKVRALLKVKT